MIEPFKNDRYDTIPRRKWINRLCPSFRSFRRNSLFLAALNTSLLGGAKVQVTGHRSQVKSQVTGHRPQVRSQATGHRSQVRLQATGHRSGHRSQKTIGHWTKLFWTDVLLYKNKISQGTLMVFLSFKQY